MKRKSIKIKNVVIPIIAIKMFVLIFFVMFYIVLGEHERIPAMIDQELYLADIQMIQNDFYELYANDDSYEAHNTLYSRVCGFLGAPLAFFEIPILAALLVNLLMHFGTTYFVVKTYLHLNGSYPAIIFLILIFSPTLTAYSLFALRDMMMVMLFTWFIYCLVRKKYLVAIGIAPIFMWLRPLMVIFMLFFILVTWGIGRYVKARKKVFVSVLLIPIIILLAYLTLEYTNMLWILNFTKDQDFSWEKFVASTVGYGVFVGDDSTGQIEESAGKITRLLMLDSILLVPFWIYSTIFLIRNGSSEQQRFAWMILLILIAESISYQAIQGNFPFRKLLPLFPMMWLGAFLGVENALNRRSRRRVKNKQAARV